MMHMQAIEQIEAEMEVVNLMFEERKKGVDKLPLSVYSERDDKIAALLEERDSIHNAYKRQVGE